MTLVALESITRPSANIPAKTMPMDVSSLMPVRRLTEPINRAIAIPVGTAAKNRTDSQQESDHHPRQDRVGKRVPHECTPARDDVGSQDRTHHPDEHGYNQRPHHKAVLEWPSNVVNHGIRPVGL